MNICLLSSKTGKGILLGLVASLFLGSANASAQDYVGGSFSFNGGSSHVSGSVNASNATVNLSPDLGWFIGERWAVGVRPRIGFGNGTSGDNESKTFTLGINPYARYLLLSHNRFGVWGEATPNFSYSRSNQYIDGNRTGYNRSFSYGVDILPVLTYQLSNHFSLESRLNVFSFGLRETHTSAGDYASDSFNCGLKASTTDIFGALGDVTIGFLYKF